MHNQAGINRRFFASLRMTLHGRQRSEEHTSELQSLRHLVCRLLLEKKKIDVTISDVNNKSRKDVLITQFVGTRLIHKEGDGKFRCLPSATGIHTQQASAYASSGHRY